MEPEERAAGKDDPSAPNRAALPARRLATGWRLAARSAAIAAAAILASLLISASLSEPGSSRDESGLRGIEPIPPELQPIEPLTGPFVVAIQAGHWEEAGLPDELERLRTGTGAESHGVREVDVNLAVARALVALIEARGWKAILLPATVPPGLRADVFVAIHADWGANPGIRGWKVAAPWRPSPASLELAASLDAAFGAQAGLSEDGSGVTIGMRGYYAFSFRRFVHAVSPFTPSAIVELGFLTNPRERELLADRPGYWAGILDRGIARFLSGFDRSRTASLRPMVLPRLAAGPNGAVVRDRPSPEGRRLWSLEAGADVIGVDEKAGWYEIFSREKRASGWVETSELTARA